MEARRGQDSELADLLDEVEDFLRDPDLKRLVDASMELQAARAVGAGEEAAAAEEEEEEKGEGEEKEEECPKDIEVKDENSDLGESPSLEHYTEKPAGEVEDAAGLLNSEDGSLDPR